MCDSEREQDLYERGGWGGRVGFGRRPALLVVDMYAAFVDPAYPFSSPSAPATVQAIQQVLAAARTAGCPCSFRRRVRDRFRQNAAGEDRRNRPAGDGASGGDEIVPELQPLAGESVVVKSAPSAFVGTDLVSYLIYHHVDTVLVTGTVTSGCVRDMALDAFGYNFRVIVPVECVCDRGITSHKVTLFDIHMKYGDVVPMEEVLRYLRTIHHGEQERATTARAGDGVG